MIKRWAARLLCSAMSGAVCGGAMAEVYVGIGAGASYTPIDCTQPYTCHNTDLGSKLYGGFALSPALAIELGYINFGKATTDAHMYGLHAHNEIKAKAVTWALALRAPFSGDWGGVARLGAARVAAKETHTLLLPDRQRTTTNPYVGLGLEYAFSQQAKAALMLDTTTGDTGAVDGSIFLLSLGLQWGF